MTTPAHTRRTARMGVVTAGLALALALALAGCFGKAAPAPSTTTSAPPASSASPSTTTAAGPSASSGAYVPASEKGPAQNVPKPVMPEAMKKNDQAGAEAAVRYFWETLYYAELTGDTGPLDESYSEYCEFCQASTYAMQKVQERKEWSTGDKATITSIASRPSEHGYVSTLITTRTGATYYNKDGSINTEDSSGPSDKEAWNTETAYEAEKGHWVVDEMKLQRSFK